MSQVSGQRPAISFIIATHNRVDTLLHTLERVEACGLGCGEYEVIVLGGGLAGIAAALASGRCDDSPGRARVQRPLH